MSLKVFLSYINEEIDLAKFIKNTLNDVFEGKVIFFLAAEGIKGGKIWKEETKEKLRSCDAIMSIITKNSVARPWILIEWSAFWLQEKIYYVLKTDDVDISQLVHPMQDRQVTSIENEESVRNLLFSLKEESKASRVPYEIADDFCLRVRKLKNEIEGRIKNKKLDKYIGNYDILPKEDNEKRDIARSFYDRGDIKIALEILKYINQDSSKKILANYFLDKEDFNSLSQVIESIKGSDILQVLAVDIIDKGYLDIKELKQILEKILARNEAESRKVAIYLIDKGKEDTDIFYFIINEMENMAELKKIAIHLIDNNKYDDIIFKDIIDEISHRNQAELRKVAVRLIENNKQKTPIFEEIVEKMSKVNQNELCKVLIELYQVDKDLFLIIRDKLVINKECFKKLSELT